MRFIQPIRLSVFFTFLFSCGPSTGSPVSEQCAQGECFQTSAGALVQTCGDVVVSVRDKKRNAELTLNARAILEKSPQNGETSTHIFNLSDKLATLTWYEGTHLNISCDDADSADELNAVTSTAVNGTATLTVKNLFQRAPRSSSGDERFASPMFFGEAILTLENVEFESAPFHRVISKLTIENIKIGE